MTVPLSQVWVVLALIVTKPLIDAITERGREVSLDLGTLWVVCMLLIGVYWLIRQRVFSWIQVLLIFSIVGLLSGSLVAAAAAANEIRLIVVEGVRVVASLVPAVVLLGDTDARCLSRYRGLLRLLALGVIVHSMAAVLQYLGYLPATYFQMGQPRPSGLYFHPVSLGLLVNVALLLVVLANSRRWLPTSKALLFSLALLAIGVLSTHRAGLFVSIFTLACWPIIRAAVEAKQLRINTRLLLGFNIALTLAAGSLLLLPQGRSFVANAFESVVGVISTEDLVPGTEGFLRGRGQRWSGALDVVASGTWEQRILGHGWQVVDPHSDYIRAFLVHGFIGALLLGLGLGVIVLGFAWRADRLGRLFIGLLVLNTLIYALTTKPLTYTFYMWAVTGLGWLASDVSRPTTKIKGTTQ